MEKKELIHQDPHAYREAVLKCFNKTNEDVEEDVGILHRWLRMQLHLPEIMSDDKIERFLIINKCSIEKTKEKIDMYYTMRFLLPELHSNPSLVYMKIFADIVHIVALPKLKDNLYRVMVIKINKPDVKDISMNNFFSRINHFSEVRMTEDYVIGDHILLDYAGTTMAHLRLLHPITLKNGLILMEKVYSQRVAGIHYINSPSFLDAILVVARSILKPKLLQRLHIHKNYESLYEHIPKDILPVDYGGEELSVSDLNDLWKLKINEYQNRFDELDKMAVNDTLRPNKLVNDDLLGFHGNFKKLNVD